MYYTCKYLKLLVVCLGEPSHTNPRPLVQELGVTMTLLVLVFDLLRGGHHVLKRDTVLHQQTYLDVHHVQVLLHLLVGADLLHHSCLLTLAL